MDNVERAINQGACQLINDLFLKIPPPHGTQTRTDAARIWSDILKDRGVPILFDEPNGVFVLAARMDGDEGHEAGSDNGEMQTVSV